MRTFDACQPLRLVVDSSHAADLDAAITAWAAVGVTSLSRGEVVAGEDVASLPVHFVAGASSEFGLYTGDEIAINDELDGSAVAVVIAHEIGHAIGLVHIAPDARVSVMNPGNLAAGPTLDDDAAVAAIWGRCD